MSNIIIFSGTTEGKAISKVLSDNHVYHTVCVATDFGRVVMEESVYAEIISSRLLAEQISELILNKGANIIIDATHPYAVEVTKNIREACMNTNTQYYRVIRESLVKNDTVFENIEQCVIRLKDVKGNILLTTGSKDLDAFCMDEEIRKRLFVRIIPTEESLKKCSEAGLDGRQIIAMVGPFCTQMNEAIIKQYGISAMVSKDSGVSGGFLQKAEAASNMGIPLFIIGRKEEEKGLKVKELLKILGYDSKCNVTLIGTGVGSDNYLTKAAKKCIDDASLLIGARRMIEPYSKSKATKELYASNDICNYLDTIIKQEEFEDVAVLLSGDTGLYSGAAKLCERLKNDERINLKVICGISSVSYFSALINEPYSESEILTLHGKSNDLGSLKSVVSKIKNSKRSYIITSGPDDIKALAKGLTDEKLGDTDMIVGFNLSYKDEQIFRLSASEASDFCGEAGLYIAFVKNDNISNKPLIKLLKDEEFIRDRVPMTKEEIRHICVQKLGLYEGATVFDIGAGTGSVSIEIAKQCEQISVFAIEKKKEAIELIHKNSEKFNADNVVVISGSAPEVLNEINVVPTHAFIGGSSNELKEIIRELFKLNPDIRIVISAISIETIAVMNEVIKEYETLNPEIISVVVSKGKRVGDYNLMEGQNPVYILSIGGKNA